MGTEWTSQWANSWNLLDCQSLTDSAESVPSSIVENLLSQPCCLLNSELLSSYVKRQLSGAEDQKFHLVRTESHQTVFLEAQVAVML